MNAFTPTNYDGMPSGSSKPSLLDLGRTLNTNMRFISKYHIFTFFKISKLFIWAAGRTQCSPDFNFISTLLQWKILLELALLCIMIVFNPKLFTDTHLSWFSNNFDRFKWIHYNYRSEKFDIFDDKRAIKYRDRFRQLLRTLFRWWFKSYLFRSFKP
jgi:magnesium-transporting ATPase (P-type)